MNISYPLTNFQRTIVANNNNKKRKRDTREKSYARLQITLRFPFHLRGRAKLLKLLLSSLLLKYRVPKRAGTRRNAAK